MTADNKETEILKEQLSTLPPPERMQAALTNTQLEVRQLFYNVFPGCPTNFTRFAFFPKKELQQEEEAWHASEQKSTTGLAPLIRQRAYVAHANVGSVSSEEIEQYLTEQHKELLRSIEDRRTKIKGRIMEIKNMIEKVARSFSWIAQKLWKRSTMNTLNSACGSLNDISNKVNTVWMQLEPQIYKNALGAGSEVTQEMVDSSFSVLEREVSVEEEKLRQVTGKLPQAREDIDEAE